MKGGYTRGVVGFRLFVWTTVTGSVEIEKTVENRSEIIDVAIETACRACLLPLFVDTTQPEDSIKQVQKEAGETMASTAELLIDSAPDIISESPLAAGEMQDKDSNGARQILDVQPQDVGGACFLSAIGYFPGIIPPAFKNSRLVSVEKILPSACIVSRSFFEWITSRVEGTSMGVQAYLFRSERSSECLWSENTGMRGQIEDVSSIFLHLRQGMVPGGSVVICRHANEDQWRQKLGVYTAAAKEIGFVLSSGKSWAKIKVPDLAKEQESSRSARPTSTKSPLRQPEAQRQYSGLFGGIPSVVPEIADISLRSSHVPTARSKFARTSYKNHKSA